MSCVVNLSIAMKAHSIDRLDISLYNVLHSSESKLDFSPMFD